MSEALARIKINNLLESAGWRFFDDDQGRANIRLEAHVALSQADLDNLGDDLEKTERGYIDFLLLDEKGFPLLVLEAKSESLQPLVGKEQARRYARRQNCRFVILSNGNLHYFWDLERGNPYVLSAFPAPDSVVGYQKVTPNPQRLVDERVGEDYIVLTQRPSYALEAAWKNEAERPAYVRNHGLRFLRDYQKNAVHALQRAVKDGGDRFLFEMATGTGKTLVAAAIIKLFLRTGNAHRVLFLVDRLELEEQARKVFTGLLSADFHTVVYKERRDDWRHAEIVVTTVQSLMFNNKYRNLFSPTDFGLVVSDEAHRSISGNARAVFDYFVGYKLGLTATPKDYLKGVEKNGMTLRDPREVERRLLLDTYRTFGCESGDPTFRYSLLDGVRDGVLINPTVVDARTDVTTLLLSEEGFAVQFTIEDTGEESEGTFKQRDFERRFFSDATNTLFCKTFMDYALRDPISGEIGKSIIFAASQDHAARLTQTLNELADVMFPGRYQSDFAVQVTSQVRDAQQFAVQFTNNNLLGYGNFLSAYKTSKARVCVTVGMMTTGYDCPDVLNLGLFRPVFSPTDFIQIKGRGTRTHNFLRDFMGGDLGDGIADTEKREFKLFDFFATCEYFENEFNYDEVIQLPAPGENGGVKERGDDEHRPVVYTDAFQHIGPDALRMLNEAPVGPTGMKIDRMFFDRFTDTVRHDKTIAEAVEAAEWERVVDYVNREVFNKPEDYFTLEKLRRSMSVDRRLALREILEKAFDLIPRFKSKDELLEEEFTKFVSDQKPSQAKSITAIKTYFKAYATSSWTREIIDNRQFASLATNPTFSLQDFRSVPETYRKLVPEYIKDYVSLNQFAA